MADLTGADENAAAQAAEDKLKKAFKGLTDGTSVQHHEVKKFIDQCTKQQPRFKVDGDGEEMIYEPDQNSDCALYIMRTMKIAHIGNQMMRVKSMMRSSALAADRKQRREALKTGAFDGNRQLPAASSSGGRASATALTGNEPQVAPTDDDATDVDMSPNDLAALAENAAAQTNRAARCMRAAANRGNAAGSADADAGIKSAVEKAVNELNIQHETEMAKLREDLAKAQKDKFPRSSENEQVLNWFGSAFIQ